MRQGQHGQVDGWQGKWEWIGLRERSKDRGHKARQTLVDRLSRAEVIDGPNKVNLFGAWKILMRWSHSREWIGHLSCA